MTVSIDKGKRRKADVTIDLNFFGGVTTTLKRIKVDLYEKNIADDLLTLMWNEVHRAVSEYTTYDSLMPLYGHFTEPYPKFNLKFTANVKSDVLEFQKIALDEKNRTKILPFEKFPIIIENYELYFERMRNAGFDVRTNITNRTIPAEHFRICYPFTLPSDWKDKTPWD